MAIFFSKPGATRHSNAFRAQPLHVANKNIPGPFSLLGTPLRMSEFTVLTCHTLQKFARGKISPLFLSAKLSPRNSPLTNPPPPPCRHPSLCLLVTAPSVHHTTPHNTTTPTLAPTPAPTPSPTPTHHSTTKHSTAQPGTGRHGTPQHNTTQHDTTQHNIKQYNTSHHGLQISFQGFHGTKSCEMHDMSQPVRNDNTTQGNSTWHKILCQKRVNTQCYGHLVSCANTGPIQSNPPPPSPRTHWLPSVRAGATARYSRKDVHMHQQL